MAKYINEIPLVIVVVPFKFKGFDYERFEISNLKSRCEVTIWDLSCLIDRTFYLNVAARQYSGEDLTIFSSFKQFFAEIGEIKKISKTKDITVMNFLPPHSMLSTIALWNFKKSHIRYIDYYNGGVPSVSRGNVNITTKYVIKALRRRIFDALNRTLRLNPPFRMVAGNYWLNKCDRSLRGNAIKLIYASSWDYSKYLANRRGQKKPINSLGRYSVLLDGAGPMFCSDDAMIGKKTFMTKEVWYPQLDNFLRKIEKSTGVKVEIAAHPKSAHKKNPDYFGFRNIHYGSTMELVENCEFVITRASTAISFAVMFRKPAIFIYSDQLLQDKLAIANVTKMAKTLGTLPINISGFSTDISDMITIDEACYQNYERDYLTSVTDFKPNSEILLTDVVQFPA